MQISAPHQENENTLADDALLHVIPAPAWIYLLSFVLVSSYVLTWLGDPGSFYFSIYAGTPIFYLSWIGLITTRALKKSGPLLDLPSIVLLLAMTAIHLGSFIHLLDLSAR